MATPLLLSPEQAAETLGFGRTRIYDLIRTGEIESHKVGRSRRIPRDALDEYVEKLRSRTAEVAA